MLVEAFSRTAARRVVRAVALHEAQDALGPLERGDGRRVDGRLDRRFNL